MQTGSYYPQSDGTAERYQRTQGVGLKQIGMDKDLDFTDGDSWDLFVKLMATQHNNNYSARIGMSPNECDLGYNVTLPIDVNTRITYVNEKHEGAKFYNKYLRNMKRVSAEIARLRLDKYDKKRKEYYDRNKTDGNYKIGDYVILYQGSLNAKGKLKSKWKGPLRIKSIFNDGMNYILIDKEGTEYPTNIHKIKKYKQREKQFMDVINNLIMSDNI